MASIALAVRIAAPINLVSAFFVPQRMLLWYAAEMQPCFELQAGASDFFSGQKVRISGRAGTKEVSLTAIITRYEWGRALEWRFQDAYGVRGTQRWELEPAGAATRVRMRDVYDMPGRLGKIFDWLLMRHFVRARDRQALARLQRLAERR